MTTIGYRNKADVIEESLKLINTSLSKEVLQRSLRWSHENYINHILREQYGNNPHVVNHPGMCYVPSVMNTSMLSWLMHDMTTSSHTRGNGTACKIQLLEIENQELRDEMNCLKKLFIDTTESLRSEIQNTKLNFNESITLFNKEVGRVIDSLKSDIHNLQTEYDSLNTRVHAIPEQVVFYTEDIHSSLNEKINKIRLQNAVLQAQFDNIQDQLKVR